VRRALEIARGHAADRFDVLGRVARDVLAVGLELLGALGDEARVVEAIAQDDVREAVVDGDVRARSELEEHVRVLGELDAPRIDHHEPCAAQHGLLEARPHDRMALGRVRTGDHEELGEIDVLVRIGAARLAERADEPERGRRVTDAGAVVDVVGAEGGAEGLLEEVVLLVGAAARADRAHGARTVAIDDGAEARGDEAERLVPARLAPAAVFAAQERRGDAIARAPVRMREAPLHAGVAAVGRSFERGVDRHDGATAHVHVERAAHAAVRTRRGDRALDGLVGAERALVDRAGRARRGAGAARDAARVREARVETGGDARAVAAAHVREGEGALDLVARAHAAPAHDALVELHREVRVSIVGRDPRRRATEAALLHPEMLGDLAQLVARARACERVLRVVPQHELDDALGHAQRGRLAGIDHHAVAQRRGARGDRAARAAHPDEAHATSPIRREARIEAERRDVDVLASRELEDRLSLLALDVVAIEDDAERSLGAGPTVGAHDEAPSRAASSAPARICSG
jgi:hypothetical protein